MDTKVIIIAVIALVIFAFFTFRNNKKKDELKKQIGKKIKGELNRPLHPTDAENENINKANIVSGQVKSDGTPEDKPQIEDTTVYPDVKSYIFDNITGHCGPEMTPAAEVKETVHRCGSLGRPYDMERTGELRFYLDRDLVNGKKLLTPSDFPTSIENTAVMLYLATVQPEASEVWNFTLIKSMLQRYGPLLLFAGLAFFAIWITVTGK